jgi:hypothetical protein
MKVIKDKYVFAYARDSSLNATIYVSKYDLEAKFSDSLFSFAVGRLIFRIDYPKLFPRSLKKIADLIQKKEVEKYENKTANSS